MAASYSSGTATSPTDLLQKLVTWLVAQGWTQDSSAADASGWRAHLHKGLVYINLRAAENESIWTYNNAAGYGVGLYVGDGYSGASNWRSQAGGPVSNGTANVIGAGIKLNAGAISSYKFFDDGLDNITVVAEPSAGLFTVMGWGPSLVKTGYTFDCWYFYGSSPSYYNTSTPGSGGPFPGHDASAAAPFSHSFYSSQIHSTCFARVDAGTFSGRWISNNDSTASTNYGNTGRQGRCAANQSGQTAALSEQNYPSYRRIIGRIYQTSYPGAMLLPLHYFVNTQPANRWAPIGYPPTA